MRELWKEWYKLHKEVLHDMPQAVASLVIVVLVLAVNVVAVFCFINNVKMAQNQKYTTPDGREWDYCVELSDKREDGIMYYMVCTNKKDLTYEEWEEACKEQESGSEDYEDFYLVKKRLRKYEDFWY